MSGYVLGRDAERDLDNLWDFVAPKFTITNAITAALTNPLGVPPVLGGRQ